jgi:NAD(P)-dependent dehydrogenase (short-subunit alcohol dehydrogenase family)
MLSGKKAIVTGGASGMGAAVVRAYIAEGAQVVSVDMNDEVGSAIARSLGDKCSFVHCDVSRRKDVDDAFAAAVKVLGGLDVLVHAAGVERTSPAEATSEDEWDFIFDVNAKGTFLTNQAAFRYLKENGGRIINFGSGAGINGMPGGAHYSASKGAVMAWTRTVAKEWGRYNIAVNAIAPVIATPMAQAHFERMTPDEFNAFKQAFSAQIPLGGWFGDPDRDLAPVVVFLASEGARFLTGQTYAVDGGAVMMKA